MKKIVTFISILALTALPMTAFAACENALNESGGELVSDTVTAEEWESIGDYTYERLNNCRIVVSDDISGEDVEKEDSKKVTALIKSDIRYMTEERGDNVTAEYIDVLVDGEWRYFVKEADGNWEEIIFDSGLPGIGNVVSDNDKQIEFIMYIASYGYADIAYDEVEYSEEHKGYYAYFKYEEDEDDSILIKFKDGMAVEMTWIERFNGIKHEYKTRIEKISGAWGITVPDEVGALLQAD